MADAAQLCALAEPADADSTPALAGGDVRVEALPLQGHVLIQLPPRCAHEHLRRALSADLPAAPNRAAGGDPALLWLGPRAWVAITASAATAAALAAQVAGALRTVGGHAVDLSDAHQSLRISGPGATALLGQGCALDLDGPAFAPGSATRTALARMPALLHRIAASTFVLHVDRSLARQCRDWFGHGVREMAALAAVAGTPGTMKGAAADRGDLR